MDKIKIVDLEVYANHGVFPEENVLGQKFLVSLTLYTKTKKAGQTDALEDSIDYGTICHSVSEYMKTNTSKLIETVAEGIAKDLLYQHALLERVKVEVKKPWAPIGLPVSYVSVVIKRSHKDYKW